MALYSFSDQLREHIAFLRQNGLDVSDLQIDVGWVRCHEVGQIPSGRGELAYVSDSSELANGCFAVRTSVRGVYGTGQFQTYGGWPDGSTSLSSPGFASVERKQEETNSLAQYEAAARRAYGFWKHCDFNGDSPYLMRKSVKAHGLRFRTTEEFGCAAVVPILDRHGKLWSYQLLNANGSKFMAKGSRLDGLFHFVGRPANGTQIGLAEGYATAATCFEVMGIPVACAFFAANLPKVARELRLMFPDSPIVIFADNDQHLEASGMPNQGILKALESKLEVGPMSWMAIPDFCGCEATKELSDWNDLLRLCGSDKVREQIRNYLNGVS